MAYFAMGILATLTVQWLWRRGYGDQILIAGIIGCVVMMFVTMTRPWP